METQYSNETNENGIDEISTQFPLYYEGQSFDTIVHAELARFFGWLSPASYGLALFDWLAHLSISPAKQADLVKNAWQKTFAILCAFHCFLNSSDQPCLETRLLDRRFQDDAWKQFPFNVYAHTFLQYEHWWDEATSSIRGVANHHLKVINFQARQALDMFSPSNFAWTNPEVLAKTLETNGSNFIHGYNNFLEDCYGFINKSPPAGTEKFQVGKNLAITKGKVIYRNDLIELIQYEPTTKTVYAEPILIIPAWIMKYYILDLSAHNSLVKYLVDQGHTVFIISWKNPHSKDRDLGLEDYLNLGVFNSLEVIKQIIPEKQVHTVGYCIGGTLLMIAAATLARDSIDRIKSITLFAAQVDFKDAGELLLFIDQSQVTYLEDIMWERGYLDGSQMAGAFSMLHTNDLIWSRMIHDYLFGKRRPMIDLIAWDHDTTRLPFRMHSEYLHHLFLNNALAAGQFKVGKKKIALPDVRSPMFAVSTTRDHVSPWQSVYKLHLLCDTDITFVLTTGGHNAGIVSEPGHAGRSYQIMTHAENDKHISAEAWREIAPRHKGSWWPAWHRWLAACSTGKTKPPPLGDAKHGLPILCDAPGTYVLQR